MTLVELKTRKAEKVYLSDVIELSAERYALQSQTGELVSEHGCVVVQQVGSRHRKVHRVQLLADERLASMVVRRERLLMDTEEPEPPCATALSEHCTYLPECNWARSNQHLGVLSARREAVAQSQSSPLGRQIGPSHPRPALDREGLFQIDCRAHQCRWRRAGRSKSARAGVLVAPRRWAFVVLYGTT